MLWVLKRTSQWDGSFEHPKHMFKLMDKAINAILGAQTILIWTWNTLIIFHFRIADDKTEIMERFSSKITIWCCLCQKNNIKVS